MSNLVSWETFRAISEYTDDDLQVSVSPIIAPCSVSIQNFCNRDFLYGNYEEYGDGERVGYFDTKERPIQEVTGIWVDTLREFEDTTKLGADYYRLLGDRIFSNSFCVYGSKVIKIQYTAGYIVPTYYRSAAPPDPVEGEYWWDTTENKLKVFESSVWVVSTLPRMPQDMELAVVEYVMWAYNRIKGSNVGVTTRTDPAGQTDFEKIMPESVKVIIQKYKRGL
jgi:hypothetical protein